MDLLSAYNKYSKYISELVISINLKGSINSKIERFNPKMIYKDSRENVVLFIPNFPISLKTLIQANVGFDEYSFSIENFIDVFSNPNKIIKIVKMVKPKEEKESKEIDDIIKNNVDFILSIYFDDKNKLTYYNKQYSIYSYNWDNTIKDKRYNKRESPLTRYYITIDLYVAGNDKEKKRLSCDIKHINIIQDLNNLGFNFDIPILDIYKYDKTKNRPSIFSPYPNLSDKYSRVRNLRPYQYYPRTTVYNPYNQLYYNRQVTPLQSPFYQQAPFQNRKLFKPITRGARLTTGGKNKKSKKYKINYIKKQKTIKNIKKYK